MTRIIAIANQKGGVGKTTTVLNLGSALAAMGYKTMLVDLDPQAALTSASGINPNALQKSIYHALLAQELDASVVVQEEIGSHLDILPANIHLAGAEIELISQPSREFLLREALSSLKTRYDFILIDCGPNLGLLTINALTAANEVLIPILCEFLALRGVGLLLDTIRRVRDRTNRRLDILGVVATQYDKRILHNREVLEELRPQFAKNIFQTTIVKSPRFAEAAAAQMPLLAYEPNHPGAEAYRSLAKEILDESNESNSNHRD